nr:hypothetical protein [Mycetohabitans rhizoxinica]
MYFCKLFDGARHDSGDPFEWGEQLLKHYELNRCDSPAPRSWSFPMHLISRRCCNCTSVFAAAANWHLAWAPT